MAFDDWFYIAHANVFNMIKIEEDKAFLLAQREKGKRGKIAKNLDKNRNLCKK